ncbi:MULTISPECIES: YbeD family protein [unclassified Moraxella]|uniref:YbeD family protein n=1 Tax=unclassified Moraxella TaxID=2685852 RepID=UPI003AF7C172
MTDKTVNISQLDAGLATKLQGKKTDIQNPELWNFPMDYPLSIIGHEGHKDTLLDEVKLILGTMFPDFDLASLTVNPSRTGRFHSVRANVYLTEAEQVNRLYQLLDDASTVRTVL